MDLNYISQVAMEVISYAGMAKSCYLTALSKYKTADGKEGDSLLEQGDQHALIAQRSHAQLLAKEMKDGESQASLLMMHAEDQLMNSETIRILVEELKVIYIKEET